MNEYNDGDNVNDENDDDNMSVSTIAVPWAPSPWTPYTGGHSLNNSPMPPTFQHPPQSPAAPPASIPPLPELGPAPASAPMSVESIGPAPAAPARAPACREYLQQQPRVALVRILIKVINATCVEAAHTPLDSMNLIALLKQQLCQITAVLACDASNQGGFGLGCRHRDQRILA